MSRAFNCILIPIASHKKVPVFLTVIGAKNYALLSDCYTPEKHRNQTLDDLIKTIEAHFEPALIIIAK